MTFLTCSTIAGVISGPDPPNQTAYYFVNKPRVEKALRRVIRGHKRDIGVFLGGWGTKPPDFRDVDHFLDLRWHHLRMVPPRPQH